MVPRVRLRPKGSVTVAHYPPGVTWGPRTLDDFELVWILSGSATWTVQPPGDEQRVLRLGPGTIAVSRPGVVESYAWDGRRHSAHAFVHFELTRPHRLAPLAQWPLVRAGGEHPVLGGLCDHLVVLGELATSAAAHRSRELLSLLVDLFVTGPFPARGSGIDSPVVTAALERVRVRWREDGIAIVSLAELAASVGVSVGHLSREFHAQFRCGLAGALELVRLTSAAVIVQRTNMTLDEVARSAGFADAYHLSRRFSRAYGLPPGRFRRAGAEADPMVAVRHAGLGPVWAATLGRPER